MAICQGRQTRGLPIELCCHTWQGDYHYFRGRCGLGLAGPLTWEEVGLAAAVRRRRRFGALTSDARLRSEGPLMRMVTQ